MNGLREICHCGHDVSSHYVDPDSSPPVRITCLCRGCDCKLYVNENAPKPSKAAPTERPKHAAWCRCARCAEYDKAHGETPTPSPGERRWQWP